MHFVENNEAGRIYIKSFEIEKLVYKYIKENNKELDCYYVSYDKSVITIFLKEQSTVEVTKLYEIQEVLKRYLANDLGLYVEKINIKLG